MSRWTKEELESVMCDIVSELAPYMTESRQFDYGQNGYPVSELVRNVIGDIEREVNLIIAENKALRSGGKPALAIDSLAALQPLTKG